MVEKGKHSALSLHFVLFSHCLRASSDSWIRRDDPRSLRMKWANKHNHEGTWGFSRQPGESLDMSGHKSITNRGASVDAGWGYCCINLQQGIRKQGSVMRKLRQLIWRDIHLISVYSRPTTLACMWAWQALHWQHAIGNLTLGISWSTWETNKHVTSETGMGCPAHRTVASLLACWVGFLERWLLSCRGLTR